MVPAERPPALFLALDLLEEVAAAPFLNRQPQIDLEKRVGSNHPVQLEDLEATVGMVGVRGTEMSQLLDEEIRRRSRWGRRLEDRDASPSADVESEIDADQTKAVLWAIRQSLSLIEMYISTSAHPRGLARDLVERRIRHLPADHLRLIRSATELVVTASEELLSSLSEARG